LNVFGKTVRAQSMDSLSSLVNQRDTIAVKALNKLFNLTYHSTPDIALDYTLKALDIALDINYQQGIAYCYNNIGVIYKNQGVLDKAMDYYSKSLRLNEDIGNSKGRASNLSNIGTVYSLQGDQDKALTYFMRAYRTLDSLGNQQDLIGALNNLGNTYLKKGEDYRAIGFYKKALEIFNRYPDTPIDPYSNIGQVYLNRGEYWRARKYFYLAKKFGEKNKNQTVMGFANHNLGIIASRTGNIDDAIKLEDTALEQSQQAMNIPLLKDIHLALAQFYYEKKEYKRAYDHRLLYDSYLQDIYTQLNNQQLNESRITYKLMKKEKELALNNKQDELMGGKSHIFIILGIMALMIIMASLFVVYFVRKSKKEETKA